MTFQEAKQKVKELAVGCGAARIDLKYELGVSISSPITGEQISCIIIIVFDYEKHRQPIYCQSECWEKSLELLKANLIPGTINSENEPNEERSELHV
jgi:hypothetical protein